MGGQSSTSKRKKSRANRCSIPVRRRNVSVDARSVDVQIQIHPSSAGSSRHPIACANEARRGRRKNWRLVLQARTGLVSPCHANATMLEYRLASSRGEKATAPNSSSDAITAWSPAQFGHKWTSPVHDQPSKRPPFPSSLAPVEIERGSSAPLTASS